MVVKGPSWDGNDETVPRCNFFCFCFLKVLQTSQKMKQMTMNAPNYVSYLFIWFWHIPIIRYAPMEPTEIRARSAVGSNALALLLLLPLLLLLLLLLLFPLLLLLLLPLLLLLLLSSSVVVPLTPLCFLSSELFLPVGLVNVGNPGKFVPKGPNGAKGLWKVVVVSLVAAVVNKGTKLVTIAS